MQKKPLKQKFPSNTLNQQRASEKPIDYFKTSDKEAVKLALLSELYRQDIMKYANDKRVAQSCDLPHPFNAEHADRLFEEADSGIRADFAILYHGAFAGIIGLGQKDNDPKSGWLSYWVAYPFWRRGIATRAVQKILNIAKAEAGIRTLYTGVWDENKASKRILLKQGFKVINTCYQARNYHSRFLDKTVFEMRCRLV